MRQLSVGYQFTIVISALLCLYYPVLSAPFNSIDDLKMVNILLNVDTINLKSLFLPNNSGQYYRPLLIFTFLVDTFVWGLQESFMHLENILLHVGSVLLLFAIASRIVAIRQLDAPWLPLVVALLFGLHPLATEPVNWVSGRTDVLAGFFLLACFRFFIEAQQRQSLWRGCCGALLLFAGCLSKETALFVLPVLLLWLLFPPRDLPLHLPVRIKALLVGIYTLAGVGYLLLRRIALSGGDKIETTITSATASTGQAFGLWDLIRVALKTSGFYAKKLIVPVPLNFGIVEISPHYLWLGLLVCGGVLYCLYRRTIVSYLFVAAFCLVSPAFILPLLKITWTPVAERYAYMAAAPFVLACLLLFMQRYYQQLSAPLVTGLVVLILVSAGVVTARRNLVWQDNLTLFEDTVKKSPGFAAARNELAIALINKGRKEEAYTLMLANSGDDFQPSSLNKAMVYLNQGKIDEARTVLLGMKAKGQERETLELLNKINEERLKKAATDETRWSIWQEMLSTLQTLEQMTGDPFYQYRIGMVQLRLNNKAAAKDAFTKAWQKAPPNSHYREAAKKLAEKL